MTEKKAQDIRILKVQLRTAAGTALEKEFGEGQILPEGLRGRLEVPSWLTGAQRVERPGGETILRGVILPGYESDAAHWMGLE